MRLYPSKIAELVSLVKSKKAKALLLYGPEKGMISWVINKVHALFEAAEHISPADSQELLLYLKSQDLFSKSKLLKIEYSSKLNKNFENLLTQEYDYFPIIIADEMPVTNALRKLFESHDKLVSISCYPDNSKGLEIFISNELMTKNKRISRDAISYIIDNSEGNRLVIANEIEKLSLYTESASISLSDVVKVISSTTSHEVDELCFAFMNKNAALYFRLLSKIKNTEDIQPIMIIRAFIRYYNKLFIVKQHSNIDRAVSELKPPVFFAYVESFKAAAHSMSRQDIIKGLRSLLVLEEKMKSNDNHDCLMEELYFCRA